jgi:outer membrane biosynthesis protein TonB
LRRVEVSPAALGSIAFHGVVALALMISWGSRDLKVGAVVPVNIVSHAPDLDARPAQQAEEAQTAMAETIEPEPLPEPAPPPPPAPPETSAAKPVEKAPAPAPEKPKPKREESSLDLDALAASLTKPSRNTPQRPSAAQRGPSRSETALAARETTGTGLASGAALQGLAEELQRRWNPNCAVEGGQDVVVKVDFLLGAGGQVVGNVASQIQGPRNPVSQAAADRAVRAVYAAAPFRGLPREFYGDRIKVTFNAREACAR